MKRKILSAMLAAAMVTGMLAGCGDGGGESSSQESSSSQEESGSSEEPGGSAEAEGSDAEEESPWQLSDGGTVLNIYCWNNEFLSRLRDHYPGYQAGAENTDTDSEGNLFGTVEGTIGDVKVVWNITPSKDNAYQNNLDEALLGQADAEADNKVDIFLVEADYALKYVNSEYSIPVNKLGITDADIADQYKYTQDVVTSSDGLLKGLSWQGCPGVMFYNREAAKEVFGSDDPDVVQEKVKDWDTFNATAKELYDAGYSIVSSAADTYRTYSNNVTSPWVVDGKINIDANLMKWVEDSKALVDAGYIGTHDLWGEDWQKGFFPEGKVFAYFGPAWLVNFSMGADKEGSIGYNGGWGATEGPQGFFWGGTWICAANGTDNASIIKDIMLKMTCDKDIMVDIVLKDDDFVNNKPAMEALANGTQLVTVTNEDGTTEEVPYSSKVLGGQNPLSKYCAGVDGLDLSNLGEYDQACNEEFQKAMLDYMKGNVDLETAKQNFFKAVKTKHPDLSY